MDKEQKIAEVKARVDYLSGEGTYSDPFISESSNFIEFAGLAQVLGYTEKLHYLESDFHGLYHTYQQWSRGAENFYGWITDANIIYYLQEFKDLGYNLPRLNKDIAQALIDLDIKKIKPLFLKACEDIWQQIAHKKDLVVKPGERYRFISHDDGKGNKTYVEGEVIKAKTKRLFLKISEEKEIPILDYRPSGNAQHGAWKYNGFEKIN